MTPISGRCEFKVTPGECKTQVIFLPRGYFCGTEFCTISFLTMKIPPETALFNDSYGSQQNRQLMSKNRTLCNSFIA